MVKVEVLWQGHKMFAKSPPMSNLRWRFCKILWSSQNIWTLITWWNKKSYCWKSSNFPWIRPVPFWIENLCEGMWCHFQWINLWIHSAFLYVSDFLSDANEGITKTIKFGFGLRFGWFYVWKWRYLGSIRYIKLVKFIHFVNSSAQGSCFHKLTADVSSG